jgi:hypothetical protein
LVRTSLDWKIPSTQEWEELYVLNEFAGILDTGISLRQDQDGRVWLSVDISQDYFESFIQSRFSSDATELSIDLRVVLRDGDDKPIALQTANEFTLTIKGEQRMTCSKAFAEVADGTLDIDLSFSPTEQLKDVYIAKTLDVGLYGTNDPCNVVYQLYSRMPGNTQDWTPWEEVEKAIRSGLPAYRSQWRFDISTSEISATFTKADFDGLRNLYLQDVVNDKA